MPTFKDMQMSLPELQDLVVAQYQKIQELEALVLALKEENEMSFRVYGLQAVPEPAFFQLGGLMALGGLGFLKRRFRPGLKLSTLANA